MEKNRVYRKFKVILFLFLLTLSLPQFLKAQNPPPPTNVNAAVGGTSSLSIGINWSYVSGCSTYKIYRAEGLTGSYGEIDEVTGINNSSQTVYIDMNLNYDSEYCYKVESCYATGQCSGMSSSYDCATTPNTPPPTTYKISGNIMCNGSGLIGVSVNYSGLVGISNANGYYEINVISGLFNKFITPTKAGFDFSPNQIPIPSLNNDLPNQDFTATSNTINTPTLYATANDETSINLSWNSVSGANYYKVYYSNGNVLTSYLQSTSTYANGLNPNTNYCFYVVAYENNNESGMVSQNSNTACATTQSNSSYVISGITKEVGGAVIPYSEVTLSGLSSTTSSSNGTYSKTVASGWNGIISANKSGFVFQSYSINPVSQNLTQDIIGEPVSQEYQISLNPPTLAFENVNIGESSAIQYFTITNTGTQTLSVSSITFPGSFSGTGFSVGTINSGSSEQVGVTFTPTNPVTYVVEITVNSNAQSGYDKVVVSGTGVSDGICDFADVPADHYAFDAVTFLCQEGMLDDDGYCQPDDPITRAALAKLAYFSIEMQQTSFADNFPSPFQDLQNSSVWYYSYAKNLTYLEYDDGIVPFDKEFFNFYPSNYISRAHALKVLIETWDIDVQNGTGLPFIDVSEDHDAYKYIYTAYQLGIIEDNDQHIFGPNVNAYRSEIFVMLHKMMDIINFTAPVPQPDDFFVPGNYTPENFASFKAMHSGNFNFYTKTSFAIASIGIPLSFEHTYNSYLTEMPNGLTPLKPLGKAWNHPYNSYVMEISGDLENPDDFRVVIALPNSGFHVYSFLNGNYECETKGVYNILEKPTSDKFTITTKNQIVYIFKKLSGSDDDFPYVLVSVHDRNGNTLSVNYESSVYKTDFFRISSVTGTAGRNLNFYYHNATDLISHITDPIGRTVYFNFDTYDVIHEESKLISFKDAKSHFSYYNYGTIEEEKFLLLSIKLPKGNIVTNIYDQKKLISTQTNGNQPTTFTYDRNYGQSGDLNYVQAVKTDPFDKVTTIDYNKNGNAHHIVTETSTINVNYNTTQTTKPDNMNIDGKTVGYTYDDMGNVLTMNLPMGVSHQFQYNTMNDLTQYTDPRSKTYTYSYDGNGNLEQAVTPRGTTTINNNSLGLVTSSTNPSGITVSYSYDSYGNMVSTNAPEGISTSSSYDMASRLSSFTNPNGKTISYQYDANDNLLLETFNSLNTQYTYDLNDNLSSITNAKNGITSMNYDFQNDFLTSVSFGGNTDQYTYEDDGRLKTHTDPKGQIFTNFYDTQQGRLQSVSVGGETVSYVYDENNNIISVTNPNGTIGFEYDVLNRITKTTDFWGNQVEYGFDMASNVTSIKYPGNKTVIYTYDDDNLLHSVKDWNNHTTIYTYRNDGMLTQINYPNGTYCNYNYDNAGRMTAMAWKKANASIINDYIFTLDPIGNHTSEQKSEPYSIATLTTQNTSYTYNNVNRITNAGSTSFTFDANGNTTSKGNRTYQHDKYDRLTSVSGDFNAQYVYDGSGNRRSNTTNGIIKHYVLDLLGMTNVLMETDASNNPLYYYIYGHGLISRIDASSQTNYYHYDFRGSTIAMTDASANITHKYQYGNFGQVIQYQEADFNPFRYVGKYGVMFEDNTLYFMRARYYDVEIGRFISEDPVWSANLYPYADNNPIVFIDGNGKRKMPLPAGYKKQPNWFNRNWNPIKQSLKMLEFATLGSKISEAAKTGGKFMKTKEDGEFIGLNTAMTVDAYNGRFKPGDNLEVGSQDWEKQFDSGIKLVEVLLGIFHKTKINPVSQGILKGFEDDDDLNPVKNLHKFQRGVKNRRSIEQDILNGRY